MPQTKSDVQAAILEVQQVGDEILETVSSLAPGVAVPAQEAEVILGLLCKLVGKAVAAYATASDAPVTVEQLQALLPNSAPLSPADTN